MEEVSGARGDPFSRVREWAIADADKIAKEAEAATCPPIAAVRGFVGAAFDSAFEAVIKAHAQEELEPSALAILFMKIDECQKRIESMSDKTWTEIWPTTPGHAFSGYTGQSGLQIVQVVIRAIYSALMVTFGYSKSHDRFPNDIEVMPISGPNMTAHFREWPRRAAKALSTRTVALATVSEIRTQANKVWSVFLDESERAEKQLLELESMTWLTLAMFACQATRGWTEHPRYSERTRVLEGRLREATKAAGIVSTEAEDIAIYRNLADLLMVRRGYTASAADRIAVADLIALLEAGALSRPSLQDASAPMASLHTERAKYRYVDERTKEVEWSDELVGFVYLSDALALLNGHAVRLNLRTPSLTELGRSLEAPGNPIHNMRRKKEGGTRNNRRVLVDDVLANIRYLLRPD